MARIIFAAILFAACSASTRVENPQNIDVPRFFQVTPTVWRSAQPTTVEQWRQLKAILGPDAIVIKLNCESEGSDYLGRLEGFDVRDLCIEPKTDPEDLAHIYSSVFEKPAGDRMLAIEVILRTECVTNNCLIHCVHGRDRTGIVAAMARVLLMGWTKADAMAEARLRGFRWFVFVGLDRWWHDWEPIVETSYSSRHGHDRIGLAKGY